MLRQLRKLARALGAGSVIPALLILAVWAGLAMAPAPGHAQTAPMPDPNETIKGCAEHIGGLNPGSYCQIMPVEYIDKPPDSTGCPRYSCAPGPGRYQEIRIINPPGSQYEFFIWAFSFVPDDVRISLEGPSSTKALPAGPALPQTIKTTQGRYAYPRASVGFRIGSGAYAWFTTNSNGEAGVNFIPPSRTGGIFHVNAACWNNGCVNEADKDITVVACIPCQEKGNPVSPGSGEKLQTEVDWEDPGAHPLSIRHHYRSQGAVQAGMGPNWTHDWAASLAGDDYNRLLLLGSGERVVFTRNAINAPWQSDSGADRLEDTAAGRIYTRASDEARLQFDQAGLLQTITQRNGWVSTTTAVLRVREGQSTSGFRRPMGRCRSGCIATASCMRCMRIIWGRRGSSPMMPRLWCGSGPTLRSAATGRLGF